MNPELENAKAAVDGFELPCGYIDEQGRLHTHVEVKEITGDEEEVLAAPNMHVNKKLSTLMAACTTAIGEYRGRDQIAKIVPDLTQGDRFYIMFAIRRVSLGDEMPLISKCPGCEQEQKVSVNLADLDLIKMKDPMRRTYTLTLPKSGKPVQMKVLTVRGEDMIAKASETGKDRLTAALLARTESIDGKPATLSDLKALSLLDRQFLRTEWQDYEGGVDTTVEVGCGACGLEYEMDVEPGSEGFFNPLGVLKKWKKRSST